MKHFVTTVSLNNPKNMDAVKFENATGADYFDHKIAQTFANGIFVPISNGVKRGEKIRLTLIVTYLERENDKKAPFVDKDGVVHPEYCVKPDVQENFNQLCKELDMIRAEIGFECEIEYFFLSDDLTADSHYEILKQLIALLTPQENEPLRRIYADFTFGMAPMPMLYFVAFNYLYRKYPNVVPEAIMYVRVDHDTTPKKKTIFEFNHIFHLNNALEKLSDANVADPLALFEQFL